MTFKQFYKKSLEERWQILSTLTDTSLFIDKASLDLETADKIIENCIGLYGVPLGLAPDFIIDGKTYHAPMATEEPSVIAAASYGAKTIAQAGGFTVLQNERAMIGQVAFHLPASTQRSALVQKVSAQKEAILAQANAAYPSIVKRGGGARDFYVEEKESADGQDRFFICYLVIDTQEAMGANMVNTMLEGIRPLLEDLVGTRAIMAILSNLATASLVKVACAIPFAHLDKPGYSGQAIAEGIVLANQLASADPYRATTHNKGIMNGISALVLASGNDTRAIEAAAHAWASQTGHYQPLTQWRIQEGVLKGQICLPLALGYVGGSIAIHPTAQRVQELSQTKNAKELAALCAALGLAQNLSALRALVSEGIQKGHMALQAKSLALAVGAKDLEVEKLVEKLLQHRPFNQEMAQDFLTALRKGDKK